MIPHNLIRWSYWAAICVLLLAGLAGIAQALYLAIALSIVQLVHYRLRTGSFMAFPVQVRLAYAAVLVVDLLWEPMRWHLWVMAFFTVVLVLFDWCMLSRIMALMPWNRREPMSWQLVRRTFISAPVKGSILDRPAPAGHAAAASA
jgi:hypothetical protein